VAGSLTKSFAIPGIRAGFGFADPSLVEEMDKIRMTWNMGQIEQTVANILIRDHMDHVEKAARIMAEESKVMHSQLSDIGFPVGEVSDSFFYFNSLKPLGIKSSEFQKLMLKGKIMVRDCASFGEPFEWFLRFSVKDRARNDAFISAAENALKELRQ
jgi:threonine-phosphate decarboxylase